MIDRRLDYRLMLALRKERASLEDKRLRRSGRSVRMRSAHADERLRGSKAGRDLAGSDSGEGLAATGATIRRTRTGGSRGGGDNVSFLVEDIGLQK